MSHKIRVLLVDDQKLVRQGFRLILSVEPDVEVVGEAADAAAAVAAVQALRPDVVLMDVQMPGADGIEATRYVLAAHPQAKVVILTTFDRDDYLFAALEAGASGFMLKTADADSLVAGIRQVHEGHALLAPEVTRRVIEAGRDRSGAGVPPASSHLLDGLTSRERDVMRLVARGLSNAEIAERLVVSEATVKTHVSNCLSKLGQRDRVQLVGLAYETGLVRVGES